MIAEMTSVSEKGNVAVLVDNDRVTLVVEGDRFPVSGDVATSVLCKMLDPKALNKAIGAGLVPKGRAQRAAAALRDLEVSSFGNVTFGSGTNGAIYFNGLPVLTTLFKYLTPAGLVETVGGTYTVVAREGSAAFEKGLKALKDNLGMKDVLARFGAALAANAVAGIGISFAGVLLTIGVLWVAFGGGSAQLASSAATLAGGARRAKRTWDEG